MERDPNDFWPKRKIAKICYLLHIGDIYMVKSDNYNACIANQGDLLL